MAYRKTGNCAVIVERTANIFGYSIRELTDKSKFRPIMRARHAAYLAARMAGFTSWQMGLAVHRDPSTCRAGTLHAVRVAARDPEFAQVCAIIAMGA